MPVDDADQLLHEIVAGHFLPGPPARVGIAVSGGGDSLALLHIMAHVAQGTGLSLHAVTVDHGLRPEARAEAVEVARIAHGLGLPHTTLSWAGWDGRGNLQDRARTGRYELLGDWAEDAGIAMVALGHTADDQAETFLMRLARASGADGLSGMAARRRIGAVTFVRPLLEQSRAGLRSYLERRNVSWIEDPSNEDTRFERVRARQALAALQPLGLTSRAICDAAANLASVRSTLAWYAFSEAQRIVTVDAGDLVIPRAAFRMLQPEIARRILLEAVGWVSGERYPPRRRTLAISLEAIREGTGVTLSGCNVAVGPGELRITREYRVVRDMVSGPGETWDGRWLLQGPWPQGAEVRAIGEDGLAQAPDWRAAGLPFRSLLGYPSVWEGERMIAAPHAGVGQNWTFRLLRDADAFFSGLLAH